MLDVFSGCRYHGCGVVVHAWCGAVGLMANYHAAFAGGGKLAEWPLPPYELRDAMLVEPLHIVDGQLQPPVVPGLGVRLETHIEQQYKFREDAVYQLPAREYAGPSDETWK